MKRNARIPDIAQLSGVSTATVDRVLNRRPGVHPTTVQRVLQAAASLGYILQPEQGFGQSALSSKTLRLMVLIPEGSNRFLKMLGDVIEYAEEHLASFNVRCQAAYIESFNPEALAQALLHYGKRCDGIAFMALEHPVVREAVVELAEKGVPVVTLISDLSNSRRVAYVGLDNRAAGRTAAYLIARFAGQQAHSQQARVAMIVGSLRYRAHEEREAGFLHLFEEQFPLLKVVGVREGHDDAERNYEQTLKLIEQHPDLAGIYNIGGGAEGIGKALKETGKEHKIVFVGHGLTPDTRALLIDGTMDAVITQNPLGAVVNCVRIFANLRDGHEITKGVETTRSQVIFRENLP